MAAPGSTNYDFPCVAAEYEPHPLPRFRDSVLISAIQSTYPKSQAELLRKLNLLPDFNQELRACDPAMRRLALGEMLRFRVATPALVSTVSNIHSFMLESYLGREPYSVLAARRLERTYKHMAAGTFPTLGETGSQFSSAIFGMPGCGKTFAIEAAEELYTSKAPVIHHEDFGIWQIPFLKLKMPFLGSSRVSLATALIRAIALLFPPGEYEQLYLRSKLNSNQVILQAFALMQIHKVGFVVIDEGQGDPKLTSGDAPVKAAERLDPTALTTTVVAGSNQAGVPLMVVGTRELEDILSSRMTLIRRTTGAGYEPLENTRSRSKVADFDRVFVIMWARQLVEVPAALSARWKSIFFFYSRGIPDIFVKLFKTCQERALDDGIPTITEELVHSVAKEELRALCKIGVALNSTNHPGALRFLWQMKDVRPQWVNWELYANTDAKKRHSEIPAWEFDEAIEQFKQELDKPHCNSKPSRSTDGTSGQPTSSAKRSIPEAVPQTASKSTTAAAKGTSSAKTMKQTASKTSDGTERTSAAAKPKTNSYAERYKRAPKSDGSYTEWQDPDRAK